MGATCKTFCRKRIAPEPEYRGDYWRRAEYERQSNTERSALWSEIENDVKTPSVSASLPSAPGTNASMAAEIADSRPDYGTYAMFQIEYAGKSLDTDAVQALVRVPYPRECIVGDDVVVRHEQGSATIFAQLLEHPPIVEISSQVCEEVLSLVSMCRELSAASRKPLDLETLPNSCVSFAQGVVRIVRTEADFYSSDSRNDCGISSSYTDPTFKPEPSNHLIVEASAKNHEQDGDVRAGWAASGGRSTTDGIRGEANAQKAVVRICADDRTIGSVLHRFPGHQVFRTVARAGLRRHDSCSGKR